ncbi:hypothetical protein [Marilutibacter aestuarii]|uniref:Uncharacterized protein n=1 Tax=Marilutibacter aestuarii TaxID=1706195 RepID=A0A508AY34_9GAMM|nr:hypothetical protein [Lysobacter aestuarii]TQD50772.1 hypothetical protein FKV25_03365 [Lysobacter aestuarii]
MPALAAARVVPGRPQAALGPGTPAPWIRGAVREVLERSPNYRNLSVDERRSLARSMVQVSALAAELIAEEDRAQREIAPGAGRGPPPLARAQSQPGFAAAADRVAGTTQAVLNAVSFPRFVTDLINGVFRAMMDSSTQQMQQYVQLLNAVSASAEGFERTQFGLAQVRQWVADHFPDAIEYETPDPDFDSDPEDAADVRLRLRDGASMPDQEAIRATLGIEPGEPVEASNPEQLVPLARRYLARQRQQMLATMVMMGMHRIVVDSGRINAAMRFHVDTRSAANEDRGSQFSLQNRVRAAGSFGVGPWGASAEIENNIGYVSTQRSQSTEEMNTDLELSSSVELNFRSDYLPLNRMAARSQADRIREASINPAAETDPATVRAERLQAQQEAERERRGAVDSAIERAGTASPAEQPLEVPGGDRTAPRDETARGSEGGAEGSGSEGGGSEAGGSTEGGGGGTEAGSDAATGGGSEAATGAGSDTATTGGEGAG